MSDTSSSPHSRGVLLDWLVGGFCALMLLMMFAIPGQETIPYHLLFLALGIVYGLRVWPLRITTITIVATTLATGAAMFIHWRQEYIEMPELVEVPLMPALLAAMVWHARTRTRAQAQVEAMAEERAANLERQREFLRDTCHAIRTPVTIARGHVDLIEASLEDELAREDIGVVKVQLERMHQLSSRLLALAEFDRDPKLVVQHTDMAGLVVEIGRHWAACTERDWRIVTGGSVWVSVDTDWFEQAADAIIENAIRFTGPTDSIRLECRQVGAECIVDVADSGPGIPTEDLEHVFERFWHRPSPGGSTGSGLGLAAVRSVVGAHAGSVEALPAPEGGAVIRIRIPIKPPFPTDSPPVSMSVR